MPSSRGRVGLQPRRAHRYAPGPPASVQGAAPRARRPEHRPDGYHPRSRRPSRTTRGCRLRASSLAGRPTTKQWRRTRATSFRSWSGCSRSCTTSPAGRWTRSAASVRRPCSIGDRDFVRLDHAAEMVDLFPDCRLAVLPATRHTEVMQRSDMLPPSSSRPGRGIRRTRRRMWVRTAQGRAHEADPRLTEEPRVASTAPVCPGSARSARLIAGQVVGEAELVVDWAEHAERRVPPLPVVDDSNTRRWRWPARGRVFQRLRLSSSTCDALKVGLDADLELKCRDAPTGTYQTLKGWLGSVKHDRPVNLEPTSTPRPRCVAVDPRCLVAIEATAVAA